MAQTTSTPQTGAPSSLPSTPTLVLRAGKRRFSFTEGYAIRVEIAEVDFLKLQVELRLRA